MPMRPGNAACEKDKLKLIGLAARFANWYYVVSATGYDRIHLPKENFLKNIEEDA